MARFYEIVKCNAQKFANERQQSVWICKAKRKTDYYIIFSLDQITPNYDVYEEVKPNIQGDTHMKRKFTIDASKKVQAAKDDAIDPRVEQAEDLQDNVAEDFDYVMSGIERLIREGLTDDATSLLNTLSDTLNSAISIIGNDFDKSAE